MLKAGWRVSECRNCKTQFTPAKKFHKLCSSCANSAGVCKTCKRVVVAVNGLLSCCGHTETKPERTRFTGKSLEESLFMLETGNSYADVEREIEEIEYGYEDDY